MSNKTSIISLLILSLISFSLGYLLENILSDNSTYVPELNIIGDITNSISLKADTKLLTFEKFALNSKHKKFIKLTEILELTKLISESNNIYFISFDGVASKINSSSVKSSYITFSEKNGWENINIDHPKSGNIKDLQNILVVSTTNLLSQVFNIILPDSNIVSFSLGQLYLSGLHNKLIFAGKSSMQKLNTVNEVSVFSMKNIFYLDDILNSTLDLDKINSITINQSEKIEYDNNSDFFEIRKNKINYVFSENKKSIKNITEIKLNSQN